MTIHQNKPPTFLSGAQIQRKADLPIRGFARAIRTNLIVPDAVLLNHTRLFNADRVPEIARLVKKEVA